MTNPDVQLEIFSDRPFLYKFLQFHIEFVDIQQDKIVDLFLK